MERKGIHITVRGIVQGVGFRPYIHKEVTGRGLYGWVRNTSEGAELELEGAPEGLAAFLRQLKEAPPPLAFIESVEAAEYVPLKDYSAFTIEASKALAERNTLISPDMGICADCLRELYDPADPRYRYPFINCTNCGPRLTIIRDVPYDRPKTTMAAFPMCPRCAREYTTITNRRYHAQPVCCPDCGPVLSYCDAAYASAKANNAFGPADVGFAAESFSAITVLATDSGIFVQGNEAALDAAKDTLRRGGIVAVKGLGGFHLACRADLPETVRRLRARKQRDGRPFALMCRSVEEARKHVEISAEEEALLSSQKRPIVLLKKRPDCCMDEVSENGFLGIMLPYTPLHYLLLEDDLQTLVMTSANLSDRPILKDNEEALRELQGIADGFLLHNRAIETRCDDSLILPFMEEDNAAALHVADESATTGPFSDKGQTSSLPPRKGHFVFLRRSRGYAPYPVVLKGCTRQLLALGAEQKASFTLSKGSYAFPSAHIGDLKNAETFMHYQGQIAHYEKLFDIRPEALVCDKHPDYLSTEFAEELSRREGLPLLKLQHHYAHLASCLADNDLTGPALGLIWDGTGLGDDGTIWGGEFIVGDFHRYERAGSLRPFHLYGGDLATKETERVAYALLQDAGIAPEGFLESSLPEKLRLQERLGLPIPLTSSMGRLFDGVSALLGICCEASYEGQGAVLLEAAAEPCEAVLPYELCKMDGRWILDERPMIRALAEALQKDPVPSTLLQTPPTISLRSSLAATFMNTLVAASAELAERICREQGLKDVVLSGGCFQNRYLLDRLPAALRAKGLNVYTHRRVSPNDEGLSLGQLAVLSARLNAQEEQLLHKIH